MNWYAGFAIVALAGCATAQAAPADDFPLRSGAVWSYAGTVNGKAVTKIVRVLDDHGRVEGDLGELAFGDPPAVHTLAWRGAMLLKGGDPWLEWPLAKGKKTCSDPKICWVVESEDSVTLDARGVAPARRKRWTVVQRDNTGTATVEIVQGVGVAAYRYHHNGSPADVDVRLVEVK